MRALPFVVAVAAAATPSLAAAQLAPRSVSVETGWIRESSGGLGDRIPLAISAAWWVSGDVELGARVAWSFAASPAVHGADVGVLETGVGLRRCLARSHLLRFQVVLDATLVRASGSSAPGGASHVRLAGGGALEAFLWKSVSLAVGVQPGILAAGARGVSLGGFLRCSAYL